VTLVAWRLWMSYVLVSTVVLSVIAVGLEGEGLDRAWRDLGLGDPP
jgi:hypothetical protein